MAQSVQIGWHVCSYIILHNDRNLFIGCVSYIFLWSHLENVDVKPAKILGNLYQHFPKINIHQMD